MNTRQKLTLGIAAIFMVTLTIVGVTYAYFVTRVEGEQTENIRVETAEIENITYVEGNPEIVKLANSVPGEFAKKTFGVNNPNDSVGTYDIVLTTGTPDANAEFLHSGNNTACYTETAYDNKATLKDTCFSTTAETYDNIVFSIYESDGVTPATAADGKTTYVKVPVKYNATAGIEQVIGTFTVPAAMAGDVSEREFVLRIDYLDTTIGELNQNIEFGAQLNIKVDITNPHVSVQQGE